MTTAISTQEQFQEQMKARIRAAAGELMPDEMLQELKTQVAAEVTRWLKENPDAIAKVLGEVVKDGIGRAVLDALERKTQYEFQTFADNLASRLRQ